MGSVNFDFDFDFPFLLMKSICVRLLCEATVQNFEISGALNGHLKLAVVD